MIPINKINRRAFMSENKFTVSLEKIINEFKLEAIYLHKPASEIMIDENDVNRPGLQLSGFYTYGSISGW